MSTTNQLGLTRSTFKRVLTAGCFCLLASTTAPVSAEPQNRLDKMISPGFHPVTFEDPRSISEARLLYVYHSIDEDFVTGGGNSQIYALQLRYAINDRLALIATKDGFVDLNTKANVPSDTGIADLEAGLKYAFYKDDDAGIIASAALRYLIPIGDEEVFQGQGDGEIHPSASVAAALTDSLTLTAGTGIRAPLDSADSLFWDTDFQLDHRTDFGSVSLYPLVGLSMIHVGRAGNRLPIADEGQDFFNFGSANADGKTLVVGAAGTRIRAHEDLDFGATFQFPLDRGEGTRILDYRWTFDAIFRF